MRNSGAPGTATWASYARSAREAALLSQVELARKLGVSRQTLGRWESGRFRPDSADDVVAFAQATNVDPTEALAAAGFMPSEAPPEPTREPDPVLDWIRDHPRLPPERKKTLIRHVLAQRARDEQARLDDLRQMIGEA